jgi:hypothetical protein
MAQNAINNVQFTSVNIVTFTSSGVYNPPQNLLWAQVELVGAGGGGGGAAATGVGQYSAGGGGGGGGYTRAVYPRSSLAPSIAITIGSGGTAGSTAGGNGGIGGTTVFGALLIGTGGEGGIGAAAATTSICNGGIGGGATGPSITINGSAGGWSWGSSAGSVTGSGGASYFSATQGGERQTIGVNGASGQLYGGGGVGAANFANQITGRSGGVGADGFVMITEQLAS